MDAHRALERIGPALPEGLHAEVDDGHLLVFARRDMLHLDADALHDHLAHWSAGELARVLPRASSTLSFRHAAPADPHEESTLDLQEVWLGLEPTFTLDLHGATEPELERFAGLIPRFVELMEKTGRPAGYRSPDVGAME